MCHTTLRCERAARGCRALIDCRCFDDTLRAERISLTALTNRRSAFSDRFHTALSDRCARSSAYYVRTGERTVVIYVPWYLREV